jgi:predicted Zn-dependent protease
MTKKLLEFIKNHPKLVVAQDFEVACQKTQIQTQQYRNGQKGIRSFDDSWWVQLKILHRNKPGIAAASALTEETLDRLVLEALLSAEQSTPDPWFRFPVWSQRADTQTQEKSDAPPESFWCSGQGMLGDTSLTFHEWYEWQEIDTLLFRRSEKVQKTSRHSAALQQWSLGRCHESFWGLENRKERIERLKSAAFSLENSIKWQRSIPSTVSLSGRAIAPILQQIAQWFHGKSVKDRKSPISSCEESPLVMSKCITLVDDGTQIRSAFSGPFDLDGIVGQKTTLVQNGIFKNALYDSYTGAMDNCRSTGNRIRVHEELEPKLRAKAICLDPGNTPPSLIWKEQGQGLALEGWSRLAFLSDRHLEGDAFGWRIEGGVPVSPICVEGLKWDLINLMSRVFLVANDTEKHGLSISPTVFVQGAL